MSSENNNYVNDSDKCPKCGAVKVFSALVCPSCGTSYAAIRGNAANTINTFDPNASFSAFKKSLEQPENDQAVKSESSKDENSILSGISELDKPVELDPIAKKVQEMTKQNAGTNQGVVGQRNLTPNATPYPPANGSPYPNQNVVRNLSQNGPTYPNPNTVPYSSQNGSPYPAANTSSYSSPYSPQGASQYASPYTNPAYNPSFTSTPVKSGKAGKIFTAVIVLIFLGMIGFAVYKFSNSDKNESGISYDTGKTEYSIYTNEWANVRINCKEELRDYTYMAYASSFQSSVRNIERSVKNKNGEVEINFVGAKEVKMGSQTVPVPAVIMMTITDNSVNSKLFGIDMEEFFNESDIRSTDLPAGYSLTRESDMLLCGHSYRTYCISGPYDNNSDMYIYMCARAIGNRLVLFYLYDIPDIINLSAIKSCFMN